MKHLLLILPFLAAASAIAENQTVQTPLTMEQLMAELRIQGGNFEFTFDKPVIAKVTVTTTEYPDGKKQREEFVTADASRTVSLFFSASALFVGDYPRGDMHGNGRKMMIKLSGCKETEGTRIIHYIDKFVENKFSDGEHGMYSPAIPKIPELDKEYILHWYFKKGDPYEAKATITFTDPSATPVSKPVSVQHRGDFDTTHERDLRAPQGTVPAGTRPKGEIGLPAQ